MRRENRKSTTPNRKVLIISSVASMISSFMLPYIYLLKNMGFQVEVATNFEYGSTCSEERIKRLRQELEEMQVKYYQVNFSRDVKDLNSVRSSLKKLLTLFHKNNYYFVHCHTPIAGALSRLAAHFTKTKVIYTAHGFHFYKGAPIKNWIIYFPIEWICSFWTDALITINKEDYKLAQKIMHSRATYYIPGVGIDINKYDDVNISKTVKRKELGVPSDAKLLISVGELNKNKNHETVIKAMSMITDNNLYYIIAGQGELTTYLENLIDSLHLCNRVKLLGYRTDTDELYNTSDAFIFPSFREGLPVSLMEAMSSGLPCIVTKIRGNVDLIDENLGGYFFSPKDILSCKYAIEKFLTTDSSPFSSYNKIKVREFSDENVQREIMGIYKSL